jgi:hypothetical protein
MSFILIFFSLICFLSFKQTKKDDVDDVDHGRFVSLGSGLEKKKYYIYMSLPPSSKEASLTLSPSHLLYHYPVPFHSRSFMFWARD